jgi:phospholipid/cholesterol/gamma-HCH transport system ATP-binding protein
MPGLKRNAETTRSKDDKKELAISTVISVRGLVNEIDGKVLHDHIDLDVHAGEILAVVGGSGSGKTVLLRSIVGLVKPKAGSVRVFGQEITELNEAALQKVEKRWGILFQEGALFSSLTVLENIQVPLRRYEHESEELMKEIALMKLSLVGLPEDVALKKPSELSGGMRKRAGLARGLALDPELLFLDEPTAGLDPISASHIDDLVCTLQKSLNLTVFMVTHDIDTLRATADRVAVLVNKKLKCGTIEELVHDDDPWIHEYFGGRRGRAALATKNS